MRDAIKRLGGDPNKINPLVIVSFMFQYPSQSSPFVNHQKKTARLNVHSEMSKTDALIHVHKEDFEETLMQNLVDFLNILSWLD